MFSHHPLFSQLADYLDGDLALDKRVELEIHLSSCPRCSGELARLQQIVELMRTDTSEDAPVPVIHRAIQLFQSRTVLTPTASSLRSRIQAVLHFDSIGLSPAFGVRSASPSARQLLFHAGADEIDLRIEPNGGTWLISGQVLSESSANGKAVLQGATGTSEAALNELSEFILPPVQEGTYKLLFHLTNADVEINEIRIGN